MNTDSPQASGNSSAAARQTERPTCTTPQVLLGVFIVAEILFLLGDNVLNWLVHLQGISGSEEAGAVVNHVGGGLAQPKPKGHWYDISTILSRWESIASQRQHWAMFSPYVDDSFSFVRVEVRWDDASPGAPAGVQAIRPPVVLRGVNEPEDLTHFVRWGPWRFQRYEDYFMGSLVLIVRERKTDDDGNVIQEAETPEQARIRWRDWIRYRLNHPHDPGANPNSQNEWVTANAYLNWRWRKYAEELEAKEGTAPPEPRQLILLLQSYVVAPVEKGSGELIASEVVPIARWLPQEAPLPARAAEGAKVVAGQRAAIQLWDPHIRQFVP